MNKNILLGLIVSLGSIGVAAEQQSDQVLAEAYAPHVSLHPDEQFFPDSVENYFLGADPSGTFMNQTSGIVVPLSSLGNDYSDPNSLPAFIRGNEAGIEENQVPIYSYIKNVAPGIVDIIYAMYYPYNAGKRTCESLEVDIKNFRASADTSITPRATQTLPDMTISSDVLCINEGHSMTLLDVYFAKIEFFAGVPLEQYNSTFGNHVTDAEYYVVRLINGEPTHILVGAHGEYKTHEWDTINKVEGTHGVIYSGRGGHGSHLAPGKRRVKLEDKSVVIDEQGAWSEGWEIFTLSADYSTSGEVDFYSIDHTAEGGKQWRTWNNVQTFKWVEANNVEGYPEFPWVKEYDGVHWGSAQAGQEAKIEIGINWSVGITERFCTPSIPMPWPIPDIPGICQSINLSESGTEKTDTSFGQFELSDTNGSLKIGRADKLYAQTDELLEQKTVYVLDAPYDYMTDGVYYESGIYNDSPVYQHQSGGYTVSIYRRNDGRWYIDFNGIDESWEGTLAYTTQAAHLPWNAPWSGNSVALRNTLNVTDAPYSYMSEGSYIYSGSYNGYPVYSKDSSGYTLSVYQRAMGKWFLDFNTVSEDWDGTLSFSNYPFEQPWSNSWSGTTKVNR